MLFVFMQLRSPENHSPLIIKICSNLYQQNVIRKSFLAKISPADDNINFESFLNIFCLFFCRKSIHRRAQDLIVHGRGPIKYPPKTDTIFNIDINNVPPDLSLGIARKTSVRQKYFLLIANNRLNQA